MSDIDRFLTGAALVGTIALIPLPPVVVLVLLTIAVIAALAYKCGRDSRRPPVLPEITDAERDVMGEFDRNRARRQGDGL